MKTELDVLYQVRVASRCTARWEAMTGDERVRHCAQCDLKVYDFSQLSSDEAVELLTQSEGRVCGRVYRRADGRVLTKDCPVGQLARVRARVGRVLLAAMSWLGIASFVGCQRRDVSEMGDVCPLGSVTNKVGEICPPGQPAQGFLKIPDAPQQPVQPQPPQNHDDRPLERTSLRPQSK
ncbi:MAG: hypothetical protein JSS27_12425 [Planctomycetes bacterium]|nr:hypothetical protein [Planctomycetota bacterium]